MWRIESGENLEIRVERSRLDRWLDTATVVVKRSGEELWMPHVRDPAPILDAFDRP
jgi:hypothetical protein